ncbi:hypothetical protein IFM89_008930 [Coptis chinensis]|uniref:Cyclin N-terminal domain-containing protein n=1 Tax=Coptis chinensis TaxID=261450 RepID=A0A835H2P3_9MAGN|nr:hypothetical protein IFM89_008930 [Coptis chinensis]
MRIRDIKAHCNEQITDMMINGGDEGSFTHLKGTGRLHYHARISEVVKILISSVISTFGGVFGLKQFQEQENKEMGSRPIVPNQPRGGAVIVVVDGPIVGKEVAAEGRLLKKNILVRPKPEKVIEISPDTEEEKSEIRRQSIEAPSKKKRVHTLTSVLTARSKVACGITNKPKDAIIDIDHDRSDNHLAIHIVDRYLSMRSVSRKILQLIGMSAMLIASKFEEIWALEGCHGPDREMENMIFFLAELALTQYELIWYCSSLLLDCAKMLAHFHSVANEDRLQAIRNKYTHPLHGAIALLPPTKYLLN